MIPRFSRPEMVNIWEPENKFKTMLEIELLACEAQAELATSSDQTSGQRRAAIRLQLAIGYFEQRQMEVALDEIKQSLQADPEFADAYGLRALVYMEIGENKLAEDNFLRALKLAPESCRAPSIRPLSCSVSGPINCW